MCFAVCEYFVELWLFPWLKAEPSSVMWLGLALAVLGDGLRKVAVVTAGRAFTHVIRTEARPEHRLVTHGVYAVWRHPGYFGWAVWAVGTQVLLRNPLATPLFALAAHSFFADRIPYEEAHLTAIFGEAYVRYKRRTPTYLPFIQ
jgi:protein-S-isoprenylcysteine O-methyltransferase